MAKQNLFRLVYTSRSNLQGSDAEVSEAIRELLATARERNAGSDITGALMFTEGSFAQVLEGAEDAITGLYYKLASDPRHTAVRLLVIESIRERTFGSWSMAYVGQNEKTAADYPGQSPGGAGDDALNGERLVELIARHLAVAAASG